MTEIHKPPYLEKIDELPGIQVWIVDGSHVRGRIDEEFTNFGQHFRFSFIPENEFWIDREQVNDERRFFIEHMLVEHRLMKAGMPYDKAIVEADRAERRERRRSGIVRRLTRAGLPDGETVHTHLWKTLESGLNVWIVDGAKVRSVFDIDFTAGGHDHVYEFVPENEIWIDNDIIEKERAYVLLHELHERNRMAEGLPYSKAHAESSRLELRSRRHPDELHDALGAEGWS
ncbi:MAG: hypothetical protein PHU25_16260 [Deltaproteobacteria bacterium]|nr:hypothetical protein [Deltaproteobacteria bacterium]